MVRNRARAPAWTNVAAKAAAAEATELLAKSRGTPGEATAHTVLISHKCPLGIAKDRTRNVMLPCSQYYVRTNLLPR